MTALWFLVALGAIFVAVLAIEAEEGQAFRLQRPAGLLTWLTHGNWPAKVGGALVVVGLGALLRYALINIDAPPPMKLAGGVAVALALGLASALVPAGGARRAVSLALGGAAFGVAYLTAYSAFGLFGYLSNPVGLGLLGVTSAAAGAYAVTRSALSLALLSMVGAFLAPAFATADPGPTVVYGYYVGASLLTLAMVALRGWHPLVHLSFVFTLAGGGFFAWTSRYYGVEHADVMLPMILLLAAVHVAMPIVERAGARAPWVERLDLAYTVALPAVAAVLCALLAPSRVDLSGALLVLGAIWAVAAVSLLLVRREGVAVHAIIAGLMLVLGLAARFRDLPWELLSLAMSVIALAIAARVRTPAGRLHDILAGLVVLFGAVHILSSAAAWDGSETAFLSGDFIERLVGAALLIHAGITCRRIGQALDTLLLAMGIVWGTVAIGIQVVRWDLATFALVVHWVLVLVAASLWLPGRKVQVGDRNAGLLAVAIMATAFWAAMGTLTPAAAWASLLASTLAVMGLAVRPVLVEADTRDQRLIAALMAPWTAALWMAAAGRLHAVDDWQFGLAAGAAVAIAVLAASRLVGAERTGWLDSALEVYGVAFATLLAIATLVDIERTTAAVVLELLCLAGLALVAWMRRARQLPYGRAVVACTVGAALLVQANLMRLLGPPGHLDVTDVLALRWPAVVSLVWAVAGSLLTIVSRRLGSRTAWAGGAALLVAAAVKLLIVDFGSLGQLANILAVIAAGGVFLLVGWLAPMPPGAEAGGGSNAAAASRAVDGPAKGSAERRLSWATTAVLGVLAALIYSKATREDVVRDVMRGPVDAPAVESEREPTAPTDDEPVGDAVDEPADESVDEVADEAVDDAAAAPDAGPSAGAGDSTPFEAEVAVEDLDSVDGAPTGGSARARPDVEPARSDGPPVATVVLAPSAGAVTSWKPSPTTGPDGERVFTQYSMPATAAVAAAADAGPPPAPAAGAAGIDQLLRERRIRRATPKDLERWLDATGTKASDQFNPERTDFRTGDQYLFGTYVVVRPMTFPEGLHGGNSATFIVPRGVERPYGDPGHSRVLEMP